MTTPFPFTLGQTLTAAQMNAITELVVNDKTASHTLTAADAGDRVIMNSASATTITVNTSVFTAGQVIYVTNKGAGVCTITAGTATVSTTGTLALAQFASGVLYCISAGVFLFEAYGVAASASGLSFVSGAAFTSVTSVNLAANTFTSTHRNYRIFLHITAAASATAATMRLRAAGADLTTSDYRYASVGLSSTNTANNFTSNGTSSWQILDTNTDPQPTVMVVDLIAPQLATQTLITGTFVASNGSFSLLMQAFSGRFTLTTVADAASFLFAGATTGVFRIYGYSDS